MRGSKGASGASLVHHKQCQPRIKKPPPPRRQKVQKVFNRFEMTNPPPNYLVVVPGCISPECFKWSGLIWGWSPWLADFKMGGSSWAGFSAYLYWPGGKLHEYKTSLYYLMSDICRSSSSYSHKARHCRLGWTWPGSFIIIWWLSSLGRWSISVGRKFGGEVFRRDLGWRRCFTFVQQRWGWQACWLPHAGPFQATRMWLAVPRRKPHSKQASKAKALIVLLWKVMNARKLLSANGWRHSKLGNMIFLLNQTFLQEEPGGSMGSLISRHT